MKNFAFRSAKAWTTYPGDHFFSPTPALSKAAKGRPNIIFVDVDHPMQTIEGFGSAFTESAAVTFYEMPAALQKEVLRAFFHPTRGNAYSLCRTHINSCDFSLGNYSCASQANDTELTSFSLERENQSILPMIRAASAVAGRPIQLLASPWSPPAWMKSNGQMNRGGKLLPRHRKTWARYYTRYIREMEKAGFSIWGLTVQNEPEATQPWDSCVYTAEDERDFVRDHLGPELVRAGLKSKRLVIWDHNRDRLYQRAKVVYDDPKAARYVWGAGFHWYCGDFFDNVRYLHDAYPEKQLLFTEGCQESGSHMGSWDTGERYARSIIADLNRWTVGWIDWNILLNEAGGPNHVGNYCSAPILYDRTLKRLKYQSSYFYIGHFSRFIRSGARRLIAASGHDSLESTAALNPDGSVAVVVLNRSQATLPYQIQVQNQHRYLVSEPRSIATVVFR
jgi:glucosylceramidase